MSFFESSSTFTSLNVTTRTDGTKRLERYMSNPRITQLESIKRAAVFVVHGLLDSVAQVEAPFGLHHEGEHRRDSLYSCTAQLEIGLVRLRVLVDMAPLYGRARGTIGVPGPTFMIARRYRALGYRSDVGDPCRGSVAIVAHHPDITFGRVGPTRRRDLGGRYARRAAASTTHPVAPFNRLAGNAITRLMRISFCGSTGRPSKIPQDPPGSTLWSTL